MQNIYFSCMQLWSLNETLSKIFSWKLDCKIFILQFSRRNLKYSAVNCFLYAIQNYMLLSNTTAVIVAARKLKLGDVALRRMTFHRSETERICYREFIQFKCCKLVLKLFWKINKIVIGKHRTSLKIAFELAITFNGYFCVWKN